MGACCRYRVAGLLAVVALAAAFGSATPLLSAATSTAWASPFVAPGTCGPLWVAEPAEPPAYYAIELVSTRRVPGARDANGVGNVSFARSPFGIAVTRAGEYVYNVDLRLQGLTPPTKGIYIAWLTTSALDEVKRLGPLDAGGTIRGQTSWNKFLVVVTLEPDDEARPRWSGPIVTRGMSRSGRMHTMAGHGPFQLEPCATYGY
jgi:hypothetical protein